MINSITPYLELSIFFFDKIYESKLDMIIHILLYNLLLHLVLHIN